jgi:hypothetical protein
MTNSSSFRDLKVWRDAMILVEDIYKLSKRFPADERFGLTAQLRRAAVSIPSNIGEGSAANDVEVQLDLAQRLGFVSQRDVQPIAKRVAEVGRMLNGLIEALQPKEVELE